MIPVFRNSDDIQKNKKLYLNAIEKVLDSSQLVLGQEVSLFEEEFSAFVGVEFGVGVNSGTDALFLALKALGIKPGDEVITVANTAVPTVSAIRATGAKPVFVDVSLEDGLIDASKIESKISSNTRAIVPVHLYGLPCEMDTIIHLARKYSLKVIEDCAQAVGAKYKGRSVGCFSDISCFSFYPTKNLGAFGDAGICLTNDRDLQSKLIALRMYGFEKRYYAMFDGYNSRMDEVQAAILRVKLRILPGELEKRR